MHNVTARARDFGFSGKVLVTPRAWANCVVWTKSDKKRTTIDCLPAGRLVWLLCKASEECDGLTPMETEVRFKLKRQPRHVGDGAEAELVVRAQGKGRRRQLIIDLATTTGRR